MAERNRLLMSPEDDFAYGQGIPADATWRNLIPMAEFGLGMAPGSGEAMSARDAWDASGRGGNALLRGNYGEAASEYLNMGTGLLGAIPGAGIIARGTKRGAAWMDRNLPEGFNRLLDAVYPQGYVPKDTAAAFPAWHGSPHDFDEFKLDKIGTGEGAQVYGHGLYFAESPSVAKHYRQALSGKPTVSVGGQADGSTGNSIADMMLYQNNGNVDAAIKDLQEHAWNTGMPVNSEAIAALNKAREEVSVSQPGRLYHAEIDAEPEDLLDWDIRFEEQSPKVQAALMRLPQVQAMVKQDEVVNGIRQRLNEIKNQRLTPELTAEGTELQRRLLIEARKAEDLDNAFHDFRSLTRTPEAVAALREAGIPGIRYLDQLSRDAGEGTRNFVIFDDSLVKILGKE